MKTLLLFLAMMLSIVSLRAQEVAIYDAAQGFSGSWKAKVTDGVTLHEGEKGLELEFAAYHEGAYEWPRLLVTSEGEDLSDTSRLIVEVEVLGSEETTVLLSAKDSDLKRGSLAGISGPVAPGGVHQISVDIGDGAPLDASEVQEIAFGQYRPERVARLMIRSIRAIRNPDFIPTRIALGERLAETGRMLDQINDLAGAATLRERYTKAQEGFEKREPRYLSTTEEQLLEIGRDLSRLAMQTRKEKLVIWRSPLAMPIRQGTLPLPHDPALESVKERVARGQHRLVCLNFSSAAQERHLTVSLKLSPELQKHVSLRPTAWAKARDHSLTADAIGASAAQVNLKVAPQETEQVLLWLDAKTAPPAVGKGGGSVEVSEDGKLVASIPLEVEWLEIGLPEQLPIATSNWAYFYTSNVSQIAGMEVEARDNLRDYGMNTWVIHYTQMPLPQLDEKKRYSGMEPDALAEFEKVMELLKGKPHENFILWLGFQREDLVERLSEPGVLSAYLHELDERLDHYGVAKDRRYLKFWDEPKLDQIMETARWMGEVRKEGLSFQLFDNGSMVPSKEEDLRAYLQQTDLWLPNWEALFLNKPQDAQRARAALKHRIGYYRCLMTRNNRGVNLYEYYRLNGWRLLEGDFSGFLFWVYVFAIGEKDAWDGTLGSSSGGQMIYVRDGKIWNSRRWELVREALDDYRLALAASANPMSDPAIRELARQALAEPNRPALADELREKLIDLSLKRQAAASN